MNGRPEILIVEDNQGLRESLAMVLGYQEYSVVEANTGEEGLLLADSNDLSAAILDINLPGIDGLETCRRLRSGGFDQPIMMLTARHEIADRVSGLDAGADDYLAKPFALDELLARVRAMLRRSASVGDIAPSGRLRLDDLALDRTSRSVRRAGQTIDLTKLEFDLLDLLMSNVNVVLSRDTIQRRIWGYGEDLASNSLEVFVSHLRRKTEIDARPRLIHTIRGVGYVAREPS